MVWSAKVSPAKQKLGLRQARIGFNELQGLLRPLLTLDATSKLDVLLDGFNLRIGQVRDLLVFAVAQLFKRLRNFWSDPFDTLQVIAEGVGSSCGRRA